MQVLKAPACLSKINDDRDPGNKNDARSIVIICLVHPQSDSEELKYVERIQNLLKEENMVGLDGDID